MLGRQAEYSSIHRVDVAHSTQSRQKYKHLFSFSQWSSSMMCIVPFIRTHQTLIFHSRIELVGHQSYSCNGPAHEQFHNISWVYSNFFAVFSCLTFHLSKELLIQKVGIGEASNSISLPSLLLLAFSSHSDPSCPAMMSLACPTLVVIDWFCNACHAASMNLYQDHLEGTNVYAACSFLFADFYMEQCFISSFQDSLPVARYALPWDYLFAYWHWLRSLVFSVFGPVSDDSEWSMKVKWLKWYVWYSPFLFHWVTGIASCRLPLSFKLVYPATIAPRSEALNLNLKTQDLSWSCRLQGNDMRTRCARFFYLPACLNADQLILQSVAFDL